MEGTPPNAYDYGGHPAPAGPALPNLINAVSMFKVKTALNGAGDREGRPYGTLRCRGDRPRSPVFDVDFNILTAFIRLGRARPEGAGCPP